MFGFIPISRGFPTVSALVVTCLLLTCGSPVGGENCGQRQLTHLGYIANGYEALEGDWPWHAGVFMNVHGMPEQRYICGGTIISENFVITAAHCTVPHRNVLAADDVMVKLGLHNQTGPSEHSKVYDVVEIIRHEAFNMDNLRNDVALLRMADDIVYSDYIQPICLWPVDKTSLSSILNSRGYVVGWGLGDTHKTAQLLQEATLAAVDYETCLKSHPTHFQKLLSDDKSSYCAGNQNQTNVCSGDSGGGMYYSIGSTWYIRGLVSTGVRPVDQSACNPKEYVIFSDVPFYLGWIGKHQENVKKRNLLNLGSCGLDSHKTNHPEKDKPLFLQYPWLAMLEFKVKGSTSNMTMCNGALIHPRFVVTVGHCVDDTASKYKLTSVRLGEYNYKTNPDIENDAKGAQVSTFIQSIDVEKVFEHPMFNQPRYDNNIALLKLKNPADTGRPNVKPICLPTLEDFNDVYTISGWKRVGKNTNIIRRDVVALEDYDTCQSVYGKMKIKLSKENKHICGTYHHKEQMDCFHYMAGAPLQYVKNADRKNQYFLKGVFAYGFPGCQLNYTDVFMNVNKYSAWIKMIVEEEGFPV